MRATPNLNLTVWDQGTDVFSRSQFANNWEAIDSNIRIAKNVEIVSSLPALSVGDAGRVVMLNTASAGWNAWSLLRWNGSSWGLIGGVEVHPSLPVTGNFPGRAVLLSAASGVFPAWTLFIYNGTTWRPVDVISVMVDGELVGSRQNINFKAGANTSLNVTDNTQQDRVDVQYSATVPTAALTVQKNGATVGSRKQVEFITGSNATLTVVDDPTHDDVDVSISAVQAIASTSPLLAYAYWNPTTIANYETARLVDFNVLQSIPTKIDTERLKIIFKVPASGKVMVKLTGTVTIDGYGSVIWGIVEGNTVIDESLADLNLGGGVNRAQTGQAATSRFSTDVAVTGLPAGTTKTWYWAHGVTKIQANWGTGARGRLFVGGRSDVNGILAGPAMMEVWGLG